MYCWSRIKNIIYCILVLYSLSNQTHTSLPELKLMSFCLYTLIPMFALVYTKSTAIPT